MNILEFKLLLAQSEFTLKEVLEILAKDENSYVRALVSKNPNTPKETLEILAKDENYWVRKRQIFFCSCTCCKKSKHSKRDS